MSDFLPITLVIPWRNDLLEPPSALDMLGLGSYDITESGELLNISGDLVWLDRLEFNIPGLKGLTLVLNASEDPNDPTMTVPFDATLSPTFELRLQAFDLSLMINNEMLRPMKSDGDGWVERRDNQGNLEPLEVTFGGASLVVDGEGEVTLQNQVSADIGAVQIGDTGLIIEIEEVTPHLSAHDPLPGAPAGFRGLQIGRVALHFPGDIALPIVPEELTFEDMLIGTGGLSGTVTGTWDPGECTGTLFGFDFELRSLTVGFRQNQLSESRLHGQVTLPYFDEVLTVEIGFGVGGKLTVRLSSDENDTNDEGLVTLRKDVLTLTLDSLGFELIDGEPLVRLAGSIQPHVPNSSLELPAVDIELMAINRHGELQIDGGWLDLPEQYGVDFHGFQLEITRLGFGKTGDGVKWLGLNGGLKLVEGLPAGASVEGLRISWDGDGLRDVSLEGVGVQFEVPEVVAFDGFVAFSRTENEERFDGTITLDLIALNVQIDAQLVIGKRDDFKFMAIYLEGDLPAGIPLFTTGLALYGFAGLYANQMEPDKADDEAWYSIDSPSWYHRGTPGVTDLTTKWAAQQGSMALGVGVTLGSAPDNGFSFNGKVLLAIVLPGPIIMLEGRANILKERTKLDAEPIFRAQAVLDNRAGTLLFGLDAQYRFDKKGRLIDITASAEAYYNFSDPLAWHVYIGKNEPREQRVSARLYSLFDATAYFMMDAERLMLGASVGYDASYSAGPFKASLEAYIETGARLSWSPAHFFGDLRLYGDVQLSAVGVSIGITAEAYLAADIFDPLHILGTLRLEASTPPLIPDPSIKVKLEWGPTPEIPPLPLPLKDVAVEHLKISTAWTLPPEAGYLLPNYDLSGDGVREEPQGGDEPDNFDDLLVVPVDARPRITFAQPVNDAAGVSVNAQPTGWIRIGDPEKNEGPVKVRYHLNALTLEKRQHDGDWLTIAESPTADGHRPLFGSFAPLPKIPSGRRDEHTDPPTDQTKLWLWSKNPFDFMRHGGSDWGDWFEENMRDYPCIDTSPPRTTLYHFDNISSEPATRISSDGWWIWEHPNHFGLSIRYRLKEVIITSAGHVAVQAGTTRVEGQGTNWLNTPGRFEGGYIELAGQLYRIESLTGSVGRETLKLTHPYVGEDLSGAAYTVYGMPHVDAIPPGTPNFDTLPRRHVFKTADTSNTAGLKHILHIQLPREEAELDLVLLQAAGHFEVKVLAFDDNLRLVDTLRQTPSPETLDVFTVRGDGIRSVILITEDKTLQIIEIFTRDKTGDDVSERHRLQQQGQSSLTYWEQSDYVFEPETTYRLRIETTIEAEGDGDLADLDRDFEQTEYAYFRTGQAPGIGGYTPPLNYSGEEPFRTGVDDLQLYVEQTIPPTRREDNSSFTPEPIYRAYDTAVVFNENYVELMYRLIGRDLQLSLFDPNDRPAQSADGGLLTLPPSWGEAPSSAAHSLQTQWLARLEQQDCLTLDRNLVRQPVEARVDRLLLNPQARYEARLVPLLYRNRFDAITAGSWSRHGDSSADWDLSDGHSINGTGLSAAQTRVVLQGSPDLSGLRGGYFGTVQQQGERLMYRITDVDPGRDAIFIDGTLPTEGDQVEWFILRPGSYEQTAGATSWRTTGSADWQDYRVHADVVVNGNGAGVLARHTQAGGYLLLMNQGTQQVELRRHTNNGQTVLASADHPITTGASFQLALEVRASTITAYVNGEQLLQLEDTNFTAGEIGLYADGKASFSDVRVEDLHADAPVVYQYAFITSRYANFAHHMNSYNGTIRRTMLDVSTLADTNFAQLHQAAVRTTQAAFQPATDAENSAYRTLLAALDAPDVVQQPDMVRVEREIAFEARVLANQSGGTVLSQTQFGTPVDGQPVTSGVLNTIGDAVGFRVDGIQSHNGQIRHQIDSALQPIVDQTYRGVLDRGPTLALLARSPEPIDWSRVEVTVERGDLLPYPSLGDSIRIVPAAGHTGTEVVGLQVLRGTHDLSGYRLEYQMLADVGGLTTDFEDARAIQNWRVVDEAPYSKRQSDWGISGGMLFQAENYYGFVGGMVNAPGTYIAGGNPAWADYTLRVQLLSRDNDAIGVLFRYQDDDNYYRFSMDRERRYRRLIRKQRGDVTVLWEDEERFETERPYTVAITGDGMRISMRLDGESLCDVNDPETAVLHGQVGLYCRANKGALFDQLTVEPIPNRWRTIATLEEGAPLTEGSQVQIATQLPEDAPAAFRYQKALLTHLPDLTQAGVTVRLVTPNGRVVSERTFARIFRPVSVQLLRSADGIGCFIMAPHPDDTLTAGTYRLRFTYHRNVSHQHPDATVQSQAGSTLPEEAILDVPWR